MRSRRPTKVQQKNVCFCVLCTVMVSACIQYFRNRRYLIRAKLCASNSSEAKASRVIIYKFPVTLPFPVYSGLQRASKSRHVHSNGVLYGRRAFHHLRMCQYAFALYASYSVLGLRSVMTTALDSDERLHSELG